MLVMYVGSLPEVAVPDVRGLEAVNGEPVDVPDDVAARLLEQSTWVEAAPAKKAEEPKRGRKHDDEDGA